MMADGRLMVGRGGESPGSRSAETPVDVDQVQIPEEKRSLTIVPPSALKQASLVRRTHLVERARQRVVRMGSWDL